MKSSRVFRFAPIALLSSMLITHLAWQPAHAESACKGLEQATCESNQDCRWQTGYARKDGVQVAGHCRALPHKKEVTTHPAAAPPAAAVPAKVKVTP
jgi:hypothetical protein